MVGERIRKIGWMVPTKHLNLSGPQASSMVASVRYRVLLPMQELAARGHEVRLIPIERSPSIETLRGLGGFDVIVLWKYAGTPGIHEQIINSARELGVMLAYDVCDDYSEHSIFGPEFLSTIRNAPILTAATPSLAGMIADRTGRAATVIAEPFEGPRGVASWQPASDGLKLLWFGHQSNLDTLDVLIPDLLDFGAKRPMALTVLSLTQSDLARQFKQFNQRHRHRLSLRYMEWSAEATWRALAAADVVVIPQQMDDKSRIAKSPNRLVESMWAGRFVVANPIPAYEEFRGWAALHERISDGLEWALAHEVDLPNRIAAAQGHIWKRYSPAAIADCWENALSVVA